MGTGVQSELMTAHNFNGQSRIVLKAMHTVGCTCRPIHTGYCTIHRRIPPVRRGQSDRIQSDCIRYSRGRMKDRNSRPVFFYRVLTAFSTRLSTFSAPPLDCQTAEKTFLDCSLYTTSSYRPTNRVRNCMQPAKCQHIAGHEGAKEREGDHE